MFPPNIPVTVLSFQLSNNLPCTVQLENGQVKENYLSSLYLHSPTTSTEAVITSTLPNLSHSWIKHVAKVTIFLTSKMTTPKQGFLFKSYTHQWSFIIPGRAALNNNRNQPIPLLDFEHVAPSLVQQHLLAQNWFISTRRSLNRITLHQPKQEP
jgi:hypothetical protein